MGSSHLPDFPGPTTSCFFMEHLDTLVFHLLYWYATHISVVIESLGLWACSVCPRFINTDSRVLFTDCRLHICLYYRDILVKELTTSSPEGCRISHGHTYDASNLDQVLFPYPEDSGQRKNIEKLLSHLERGLVLWMAPDGLYAKRLCQSRIYWDGPLALCSDRPNKLERDQTCKLFDTQQFLSGNIPHNLFDGGGDGCWLGRSQMVEFAQTGVFLLRSWAHPGIWFLFDPFVYCVFPLINRGSGRGSPWPGQDRLWCKLIS